MSHPSVAVQPAAPQVNADPGKPGLDVRPLPAMRLVLRASSGATRVVQASPELVALFRELQARLVVQGEAPRRISLSQGTVLTNGGERILFADELLKIRKALYDQGFQLVPTIYHRERRSHAQAPQKGEVASPRLRQLQEQSFDPIQALDGKTVQQKVNALRQRCVARHLIEKARRIVQGRNEVVQRELSALDPFALDFAILHGHRQDLEAARTQVEELIHQHPAPHKHLGLFGSTVDEEEEKRYAGEIAALWITDPQEFFDARRKLGIPDTQSPHELLFVKLAAASVEGDVDEELRSSRFDALFGRLKPEEQAMLRNELSTDLKHLHATLKNESPALPKWKPWSDVADKGDAVLAQTVQAEVRYVLENKPAP